MIHWTWVTIHQLHSLCLEQSHELQQIMIYPCENRPLISFDYTFTLAILHMSLNFAKEMLLKVKARAHCCTANCRNKDCQASPCLTDKRSKSFAAKLCYNRSDHRCIPLMPFRKNAAGMEQWMDRPDRLRMANKSKAMAVGCPGRTCHHAAVTVVLKCLEYFRLNRSSLQSCLNLIPALTGATFCHICHRFLRNQLPLKWVMLSIHFYPRISLRSRQILCRRL